MNDSKSFLAIFGGPAGAGKTTLARAWACSRKLAVHIQLDEVGNLIVSGKANFEVPGRIQEQQVSASAHACCALAKSFLLDGFDVAVDHVFHYGEFEKDWEPYLSGVYCGVVIVRPDLETTLERGRKRTKRVPEVLIPFQHQETGRWPAKYQLDSTDLDIPSSLERVKNILQLTARVI